VLVFYFWGGEEEGFGSHRRRLFRYGERPVVGDEDIGLSVLRSMLTSV